MRMNVIMSKCVRKTKVIKVGFSSLLIVIKYCCFNLHAHTHANAHARARSRSHSHSHSHVHAHNYTHTQKDYHIKVNTILGRNC